MIGRSNKEVFSFLMERIWKKSKGWKEGFMSMEVKEVLIKVVAQVILNYNMSYYKLPESCCGDIEAMLGKKIGEQGIGRGRYTS